MSAVMMTALLLLSFSAPALAASVSGNTAYVNTGNIENQTIVGEGENNNVIITNTTEDAPSPTGILMANAPMFIIGAFIVAGVVVVVARARKKAGEDDE